MNPCIAAEALTGYSNDLIVCQASLSSMSPVKHCPTPSRLETLSIESPSPTPHAVNSFACCILSTHHSPLPVSPSLPEPQSWSLNPPHSIGAGSHQTPLNHPSQSCTADPLQIRLLLHTCIACQMTYCTEWFNSPVLLVQQSINLSCTKHVCTPNSVQA